MRLPGTMAMAHSVVHLGLLHMRHLQSWFRQLKMDLVHQKWRQLLVPRSVSTDLSYWRDMIVIKAGVSVGRVMTFVPVRMDASLTGWGGTCLSHAVGGKWLLPHRHINLLEFIAVCLMLQKYMPTLVFSKTQRQSSGSGCSSAHSVASDFALCLSSSPSNRVKKEKLSALLVAPNPH